MLPFNPQSGIGQGNKVYAEGELKVKIGVDQDPIQQGDTQKIIVTVRDANSNDKIGDAFIKLAVEPPSGKIGTGTANTDDNGQATFNIRISSDADTGTFNVAARASENGYASKTVTTSFQVVSNDNNNGDNDGNNNNNNGHNGHPHGGNNNNNNNNDQVQVISQSNECGNGKFSSDINCQNIGNQIQSGGHNKNSGHHGGQSQSAAQANVCGNGKGASDINCQNLSNQIQGDGNAVNVIGVQSGGGGGSDGGSSHGDGNDNGGNDGQTGQLGVQQSGTSSGGGGGSGGNGGGHHGGQSQSAAQANVCGNGKGASDINCQNLSNQIQGDGNAVNVIGVQPDSSIGNDQYPSLNDQGNAGFTRTVHSDTNNGNDFGTIYSANSNPFSDACDQAINRHVAVGGLHGEMASQMRGQLCG
ncbi:MAG TPA: hypothetical protein VH796_15380 [Nitrososphaeraceae archaeon]